jgi:ATP-dependent Clp protease ATP-binding subunit ClpA
MSDIAFSKHVQTATEHCIKSKGDFGCCLAAKLATKSSRLTAVLSSLNPPITLRDFISAMKASAAMMIEKSSSKGDILVTAVEEARRENSTIIHPDHALCAILLSSGEGITRAMEAIGTTAVAVAKAIRAKVEQATSKEKTEETDNENRVASPEQIAVKTSLFCTDLTKMAAEGKLDPVIGRETEISRLASILCKKHKRNPILIGSGGVGKTAIVEGLSIMMAEGTAPKGLNGCRIVSLDLGAMVAGTKYRGQFEEKMMSIIKEASDDKEMILFIDEVHNITNAGSGENSIDAAEMLKPVLARGQVRCIGATTPEDYASSIEHDEALSRRFVPVFISEPDEAQTLSVLHGLRQKYEDHHGISIPNKTLDMCVRSSEYAMPGRRLPDRAIDLLDESCALALSSNDCCASLEPVHVQTMAETMRSGSHGSADKSLSQVFGQDTAITVVKEVMAVAMGGVSAMPSCIFMHGPQGCGKGWTAKKMSEAMSPSDAEFSMVVNMTKIEDGTTLVCESIIADKLRWRNSLVLVLENTQNATGDTLEWLSSWPSKRYLIDSRGRRCPCASLVVVAIHHDKESTTAGFKSNSDIANKTNIPAGFKDACFYKIDKNALQSIIERELSSVKTSCEAKGIKLSWQEDFPKAFIDSMPEIEHNPKQVTEAVYSSVPYAISAVNGNTNVSLIINDGKVIAEKISKKRKNISTDAISRQS